MKEANIMTSQVHNRNDINSCVELCALENAMNMGARCLDFEIYNKNGLPIVATSSKMDSNFTKDDIQDFDNIAQSISESIKIAP